MSSIKLKKTWVILGGGGSFAIQLGKYLLGKNLDDGFDMWVIGVGRRPLRPPHFSLGIEKHPQYSYNEFHIVHEMDMLLEFLDRVKPDVIVNFAAQGEGAVSWRHSWRFFETNAMALSRLFEQLTHRDWFMDSSRFIHIGTSELYGTAGDSPHDEDSPIRPTSPYAASKAAFDMYLLSVARDGAPFNIIRPSNAYCPGQLLHRLIPRAVVCGMTGQKLPLHGGGTVEKSYIHALDLARAVYLVEKAGNSARWVYNVGPAAPVSIRQVVETCARVLALSPSDLFEVTGDRPGQDNRYWLDSTRIFEDTGWAPRIDLEWGIRTVADWAVENLPALRHCSQEYTFRD